MCYFISLFCSKSTTLFYFEWFYSTGFDVVLKEFFAWQSQYKTQYTHTHTQASGAPWACVDVLASTEYVPSFELNITHFDVVQASLSYFSFYYYFFSAWMYLNGIVQCSDGVVLVFSVCSDRVHLWKFCVARFTNKYTWNVLVSFRWSCQVLTRYDFHGCIARTVAVEFLATASHRVKFHGTDVRLTYI